MANDDKINWTHVIIGIVFFLLSGGVIMARGTFFRMLPWGPVISSLLTCASSATGGLLLKKGFQL